MGNVLEIRNEEAVRLAETLGSMRGCSPEEAVVRILRESVAAQATEQNRQRAIEEEVHRMLADGAEIRAHMRGNPSSDLSDLYDEDGMPK